MSSARALLGGLVMSLAASGFAAPALAQAWGEQAPVQFKFMNQGLTTEVYRNQLGAAAAAAAGGVGGGALGSGQSSNQLNNAVQIINNNNYNVSVSGEDNVLNFQGDTVNAQQSSTGTTQTNSNSANRNTTNSVNRGSRPEVLNQ